MDTSQRAQVYLSDTRAETCGPLQQHSGDSNNGTFEVPPIQAPRPENVIAQQKLISKPLRVPEVMEAIRQLPIGKAAGPDGIFNKRIKAAMFQTPC